MTYDFNDVLRFYRDFCLGRGAERGAVVGSVTRKKSPNVYKSCPKMISLEK